MDSVEVNKDTLSTERTGCLALSLALLDELGVALDRVFGLVALTTGDAVPAERLLANGAHSLAIRVLARNLHVGADVIVVTGESTAEDTLPIVELVLDGGLLATERAACLTLGLAFLDKLGVAVQGLLLGVAHLAREALTTEVLLADVAYHLAILDALDGKTGADVIVIAVDVGRVEPVGEGEHSRGGREGNLDGDRDGVIVGVECERRSARAASGSYQGSGEDEERSAGELHCARLEFVVRLLQWIACSEKAGDGVRIRAGVVMKGKS